MLSSTILYGNSPADKWITQLDKQRELRLSDANTSIKIGSEIIQKCNNDSIKAQSYSLLGVSHVVKNDLANAFKYIYEAKEMMSERKFPLRLIIRNNVILIDVFTRLELYDHAQTEINNTIALITKHNSKDYFEIGMLYASYGGLLMYKKNYKESLSKYKVSLSNLDKVSDPKLREKKHFLSAMNLSEIGNIYLWMNDINKAEHYIILSKKTLADYPAPYLEFSNTLREGIVYFKSKKYQECIETLHTLSTNPDADIVLQQDIHNFMADAYKNLGDDANYKIQQAKSDSIKHIFSEQKNASLKNVVSQVEIQLAVKKRESLLYKVMIISISILTIGILIIGITLYKRRIKKEKTKYDLLIAEIKQKLTSDKQTTKEDKKLKEVELTKTGLILIDKLNQFEQEKGFLNKDLNIAVLAVELGTNASYLSDVINKSKNKNFNSYINELRINYITQELYTNPKLLQYKISHLADISGFNSHNTFTLVFKKITKTSPSFFIEQLRKETQGES